MGTYFSNVAGFTAIGALSLCLSYVWQNEDQYPKEPNVFLHFLGVTWMGIGILMLVALLFGVKP